MEPRDLQFILAYSEMHGLLDSPWEEVVNHLCEMFTEEGFSAVMDPEEYIKNFMYSYNFMKETHIEDEIRNIMKEGNESFLSACLIWDLRNSL